MDEEILIVIPLVVGGVAVGAVLTGDSGVTLADLVPGLAAFAAFAVGMFVLARRYGWGKPDPESDAATRADGGTQNTPAPFVRRRDDVTYEAVDAADGMRKGVLVGEEDGASNLAIRRFVLSPGASVPRHTNEIEHEQYVLEGGYTVGIGEEEYEVEAGDSLFIPAGTVHWYRNDRSEQGSFVCAVPTGDDRIELAE
jgi:quercetin dioxygenase-like cupin family protein